MRYRVQSATGIEPPQGEYPSLPAAVIDALRVCDHEGIKPSDITMVFRFYAIEEIEPGAVGLALLEIRQLAQGLAPDGQEGPGA